ncbi:Uncharacterised protein [marine metagenome]
MFADTFPDRSTIAALLPAIMAALLSVVAEAADKDPPIMSAFAAICAPLNSTIDLLASMISWFISTSWELIAAIFSLILRTELFKPERCRRKSKADLLVCALT